MADLFSANPSPELPKQPDKQPEPQPAQPAQPAQPPLIQPLRPLADYDLLSLSCSQPESSRKVNDQPSDYQWEIGGSADWFLQYFTLERIREQFVELDNYRGHVFCKEVPVRWGFDGYRRFLTPEKRGQMDKLKDKYEGYYTKKWTRSEIKSVKSLLTTALLKCKEPEPIVADVPTEQEQRAQLLKWSGLWKEWNVFQSLHLALEIVNRYNHVADERHEEYKKKSGEGNVKWVDKFDLKHVKAGM